MKIQYASDLHLEFGENWQYLKKHPLEVKGEILLLAGDVCYLGNDGYPKHPFWDWASDNYSQVLCCMGNHEFYRFYDVATLHDGCSMEIRHNIHGYYNGVVRLGEIDIILSTLWSRIPLEDAYITERSVSDFRRIVYEGEIMTFSEFNKEHERCLAFVKRSVSESTAPHKVVVTHHVPSYMMQNPQFNISKTNGAFIVELADYIEACGVDYWIYGHSHYNKDVVIGNTHCVSNQLGYVFAGEHVDFVPGKTFIV